MQNPEFVEVKTKDGLRLPGLFYPAKNKKTAAIYLHGNGSSSIFYRDDRNKPMTEALNKKGVSILYFNNRGAHYVKTLYLGKGKDMKRKRYGMAYEKIKECVADIEGAIAFLKDRGYEKFYLIGSSTGANKICVYDHYRPKNPIDKYILLSGGDDTGGYYDALGKTKFYKLLAIAKQKIGEKKGNDIIPELLPDIFAYAGFYDIANPDGDYNVFPFFEVINKVKLSSKPLFRYFRSLKKPSIVIYGEKDEFAWGDVPGVVDILKSYQPKLDYRIIKNADHGFNGFESELAEKIVSWL